MPESVTWLPISALPDFGDSPDHLLPWNPCDGPPLTWVTYHGPRLIEEIRGGYGQWGGLFTAWARCPEPQGALREWPTGITSAAAPRRR